MATTSIELDIENITGVSDADDQFIISAQKFVVSSVPKDLLTWASSETTAGSHGGDSSPTAITLPVGTDNIISVRRGSYIANQVPIEDSPYISDSNSLKFATSKHPKYWLDPANKVQVKPAPSDSTTAHVQYVDFSKLDDDSDLRNAIIFHACAKEFTKLSSDVMPDWSDVTAPVAPTAPDFGSDLSITSVAPNVPTISTVSYTDATNADASASSISTITVASVNKADISGNAPAYTKPTITTRVSFDTFFDGSTNSFGDSDPGVFTISSVIPVAPAISTVSYTDATNSDVSGVGTISPITVSAVSKADISGDVPTYTKPSTAIVASAPTAPSITTVSFTDPGLSIVGTEPSAVSLTTVNYSDANQTSVESLVPPVYSGPTLGSRTSFEDFWNLSEDGNAFGDNDPGDFSISATVPVAPQTPKFTTPSVSAITIDSLPTSPVYVPPVMQAPDWADVENWITTEEDSEMLESRIQAIQAKVADYSARLGQAQTEFQKEMAVYQAGVEKNLQQAQINMQDAQAESNLLLEQQNKEYIQDIALFQAQLSNYQSEVQKEVQEYGQKLARYQLEVGVVYTSWVETENRTISIFQAELAASQADFQARATEFQAELQKKLTDAQEANKIALQNATQEAKDAIENNNAALAKYNAESQVYSTNIQKGIQSYSAELQSASQTMQATVEDNQAIISKYANELKSFDSQIQKELSVIQVNLQNELNEFNKENVRYQANVQAELAKHQSDLQKVLTQAQLDAQDAQQEAALAVDIAKFNKAQDQALALENAAKQIEDVIADNGNKIQKYGSELSAYQAEVQSEVQEYSQKLARYQAEIAVVMEAWSKTESDSLQQYQLDIQNEVNEFNKENAIYQANIQAELAKHQSDLQKVLTQAQIDAQDAQQEATLTTDVSKFNKAQDQALALENAAKQMEDLIADNASKIQKYQAELQSYQSNISKEVEEYNATLSKEVQEYQSKVGLYTSDLQKYQAEVASETQKTALNSQKAQLYEAEANKYYQWAVAEVQTYVQNNSKMIGMQMAAQAAQK